MTITWETVRDELNISTEDELIIALEKELIKTMIDIREKKVFHRRNWQKCVI